MAKGYLPLPDGSFVTVRDDETPEQAFARARREYPEAFEVKAPPPKQEEGAIAAGIGGAKRMVSTIGTGLEALISPEEAARKGVERGEAISQQYAPGASLEAVKKAYEERGLLGGAGEVVSQIPGALAEQFPQIAATLGSAKAGAMAGQRIGGARGAVIGGVGGALAPSLAQLFGANIERQAAEQMEEGKPLDISRTKAAAAAVPGAALEVASTFIPLGRNIVGKLFGPGAQQALARGATEATERLAKEGLAKVLAKGTAVGVGVEGGTEVIQQMLERAQAGLPLTTDDALAEYGEALYGAGLVGGPFGAVGRVGQRAVARGEVAETEAKARADQEALAAEAQKQEEERAAAEQEAKIKSPQYRQELNAQIIETKDRLREIENVLKDKTLDPDVKKEAIEEAKTLRKTIGELNTKMKESMAAIGEAPTLQKALAKQKEAPEARTIVDEFGNVVKPKTQPLTDEEEAAGYELQAARVAAEFEKRERDFQALQEKNQQEEAKKLLKDEEVQAQMRTFLEGYDELQKQPYGPTEFVKSEREKQQAQEITLDRMQLALDKFTPRLLGLKPDETVAKLQAEYDRLSAPEAIAKVKSSARPNYMNMLERLKGRLRTSFEKAAPNSRQGYDNALANGLVNRFVTSTLGIKGLGGRTLSFNDALPQVEARIAELEEKRQQAITSKDPLMSDKGQLTPAGEKLVVNEAKLKELKRIVAGAREQMPTETGAESAIEGTLKATTAAQAESPAIQVEQGLPRAAYDGRIKTANQKAARAFDDLLSFVNDLQRKRFFGGAPALIEDARFTEEGLREQVKRSKGLIIDGLLEEIATARVANKMRPLSKSEAYLFVEDVAGLVDMLVERSLAAAPGMRTETVTTPGQMRGTKLVKGATETEIDTRTERQLPFGATPRSQDIIASMSEEDQEKLAEKFTNLRKRVKDAAYTVEQIDARLNAMEPPKPVAKRGEPAPEPTQRRATLPESPEAQALAAERVKALDALRKAQEDLAAELNTINNAVRGVSEKQAVQTVRNVIRSLKESTIEEGAFAKQLNRPLLRQQFASAPREETLAQKADRVVEEVDDILRMEGVEQDVLDTFQEAADFIALRTDVSGEKNDFIDLVDEQVQRIKQGIDNVDAPELLGDIRGFLSEQRRGREFAQADETMMVTKGKRFEEVRTQPDLFPETVATERASPGMFQRLQKSKEVTGKREAIAESKLKKAKAEADLKQLERDLRAAKRSADTDAVAALEKEEQTIFEEITKLAENIKRGMGDNISTTNAQKFAALDDRIKKLVAEYKKKKPAVTTSEVAENERVLNRILKEPDTPEPYDITSGSSVADFASSVTALRARMRALEAKIKDATSALMEVVNNPEVYEAKFKGLARYKKRGAAKARVEKLIEARTRFLEDAKKQLDNFELIIKKTLVQPKAVAEEVKMPIPAAELRAAKQALATRINATLRRLQEQDIKLTEDVRGFIGLGLNLPGLRVTRKSDEQIARELAGARAEAERKRKEAKSAGKTAEEIAAIKTKVPSKFNIAKIEDQDTIRKKQREMARNPSKLEASAVRNFVDLEKQEVAAEDALRKAKKDVKDWTKLINEAKTAKDQKTFKEYEPRFYAELDKLAKAEEAAQNKLDTIRANKNMFYELRQIEYKTKPSPRQRTTTGETKPAGLGVTEQQMYEYGVFGQAGGVSIKTNNEPEFAIGDSDPTGEIDVAEAKKFLADVKAKAAKQGIKVKIYPIAEVLSPQLYGPTLAALGPEAARRVKGGVDPDGTVFFVIESHNTLQDLKETVAHELIGHYTFEGMLGEKGLKRLLNRLEKTHGNISKLAEKIGGQDLRRKVAQAEAMMKKLGKTDDEVRMRGLNELVAYTMEKRVDQDFLTRAKQWLQELVGAIRLGLRELGIDMGGMSTSELFYLMRQADRNFKAGKPVARIESDGTVKYSVAAAPAEKTGFDSIIADRGEYFDRAKGFATGMTGLAGRVKFLDRFAAIEAVMKKGLSAGEIDSLKAADAMYFNRMADQRNNFVAQFATGGVAKIIMKKGERIYESAGGVSLKDVSEALAKSGLPAADVERQFTAYIAALRVSQIANGLQKLSTRGQVTAAQVREKIAQYENNAAFKEAREKYKQYNNDLIDFVVSAGAMSKEKGASLKNKDYIPFYRTEGNDVFLDIMGESPIRIGDLKNQPYLQELVGGEKSILPVFTSALTNTSVLTDMALKNMATANTVDALRQLGIAKVSKGKGPANQNVLRFKVEGEDFFAVVDTQAKKDLFGDIPTELLVEGMEGIKGVLPVGIRMLGAPANWLRKFVTRDPRYAFRQIFRDSMAAVMTTGANFVPVVQTFKDMATMKKTGALQTLQKRGVVGGQVITGADDDMGKILQQIASGKTGWNMAMAKLDELAMMGDAATRVSMYNSFLQQGLSEREATLATLEAMNFSRRGTSISVLYANTLIPFFNAGLQGLDVLYRAFKGDMPASEKLRVKQKIYVRMGIMASITVAYAMMMDEEEAYKNANDEERLLNWFVPTPFGTLRVPIPFELGLIAKAAPESIYRYLTTDASMSEVAKALKEVAFRSIPIDIPTAAKPIIEWQLNRSFFTDRDIVTASMPEDPKFQYNLTTPEIVKLFGNIGISPAKLENAIRGYTGSLGVSMLRLLDPVFGGEIVKPGQGLANVPIVGGIFQPEDASGIINAAYNSANEFEAISRTYKRLEAEDPEEADKYYESKLNELSMVSDAGRFKKYMGDLTREEREIRADKTMPPADKDRYLKEIRQEKIEASREFRQLVAETRRQAA